MTPLHPLQAACITNNVHRLKRELTVQCTYVIHSQVHTFKDKNKYVSANDRKKDSPLLPVPSIFQLSK